ncbi:TPA: hypothetical protein ACH3X1_003553 [Trebouxia sp. C0004]
MTVRTPFAQPRAQLLLMQRLTARLDAQQPGRDGILPNSSADADQDTLQLWNEVQQEYHMLFETPAADPDAVTRWRNRALRFILPANPNAPDIVHKPAAGNQSEGFAANKPAEAWLPEACWSGLPVSLLPSAGSSAQTAADHDSSVTLLPGGRGEETGEAATISYTSLSQLQTLSRLQHQLQMYLWQQHIESAVAAPLVPQLRKSNAATRTETQPSQQTLAQIRLAHGFLCKGAECGLCTMTQERIL